jgi:hypothetical protein
MSEADEAADLSLAALRSVPNFYFNGFQLGLSNADLWTLFLLDNQPIFKANMSYTVAKTLMVKLQSMVETLEKATGREIMTTDDAGRGLEGNKA